MHYFRRKGWEIPEREATTEALFLNRRAVLGAGAGSILAGALPAMAADEPDPSASLYPAKRNEKYALDRAITDETINDHYNNFYEFGTGKDIAAPAQALRIRPWTVKIDGMVEKPFEIAIDDLAGDGDHYRARIVSTAFAGLPRVRQHQLVYAALKGKMGGELHALALETSTPKEG